MANIFRILLTFHDPPEECLGNSPWQPSVLKCDGKKRQFQRLGIWLQKHFPWHTLSRLVVSSEALPPLFLLKIQKISIFIWNYHCTVGLASQNLNFSTRRPVIHHTYLFSPNALEECLDWWLMMLCQIFLFSVFLEISKSADYITHTWGLLPGESRQNRKAKKYNLFKVNTVKEVSN